MSKTYTFPWEGILVKITIHERRCLHFLSYILYTMCLENCLCELTPTEIHWSSEDPAGNFTITFEPVFSSVVFSGRILQQSRIRMLSKSQKKIYRQNYRRQLPRGKLVAYQSGSTTEYSERYWQLPADDFDAIVLLGLPSCLEVGHPDGSPPSQPRQEHTQRNRGSSKR